MQESKGISETKTKRKLKIQVLREISTDADLEGWGGFSDLGINKAEFYF